MATATDTPAVRRVSSCTVKPADHLHLPEEAKEHLHLTPWDLPHLSAHYMQTGGFVFSKPSPNSKSHLQADPMPQILHTLKNSLSHALFHFYPLAGRLATNTTSSSSCFVYIDCATAPGVEFVHAIADGVTVDNVLSPPHIPPFVYSFFPYNEALNLDAHTIPLLAVQVTELVDGFFLGCSFNHLVGDGRAFWNFMNQWSEISRSLINATDHDHEVGSSDDQPITISRPPIFKRFVLEPYGSIVNLPFSDPTHLVISRDNPTELVDRVFHFSPESLAKLKARVNYQTTTSTTTITTNNVSTFRSLCALLWTSVTRARHVPVEQATLWFMLADNRSRLDPPLSPEYFGNCTHTIFGYTTVGKVLEGGLEWAAQMMNDKVQAHSDGAVRQQFEEFIKQPKFNEFARVAGLSIVLFASSPRFDGYGNDFGWGKPVGLRGGMGSKFDGKVASYPGREGKGSIDMIVSLIPETIAELEKDEEFMSFVS